MDDVEPVIEPREPLLDIAAFLVFLRLVGCGLGRAVEQARLRGYTATEYIVRQHRRLLASGGIIVYHGRSVCIGPRGAEIVDACGGDVECVWRRLEELARKGY